VDTAPLERRRHRALDLQVEVEHAGRGGDGGAGVPQLLSGDGGDVARHVGVDEVLGPAGGVEAHDGGQGLVVDDDAFGHVLGHVAVDGHDHDDRLTDVVHLAVGQGVLGAGLRQVGMGDQQGQRVGQAPGQVVPGVDAHQPVDVERVGDVDAGDAGVGVRAADEGDGQRLVPGVVEEPAGPGQQALVLPALDPLAEPLRRHGRASSPSSLSSPGRANSSAARWTERTMLT
jgi:hypothetical protein